jgi:hypothetical protein
VTPGTTLLRDGLTWESLADGRPHRLKHGKHFQGDLRGLQLEAAKVAEAHGWGLLTTRDELGSRNRYVWVQFADQRLIAGKPCRCGSLQLTRVHDLYGRCDRCGATMVFDGGPSPGGPAWRPGQRMQDYEDLMLIARDDAASDATLERWYGRAIDPAGWTVLLQVDFPLSDGRRLPDPADPDSDLHEIRRWAIEPFLEAARLGVFDGWERAAALPPFGEER